MLNSLEVVSGVPGYNTGRRIDGLFEALTTDNFNRMARLYEIRRDNPDGFAFSYSLNVGNVGASASLVVLPNQGIYGSVDVTGGADIEGLRRLARPQGGAPSRLIRPAVVLPNQGIYGSVDVTGGADIEGLRRLARPQGGAPSRLIRPAPAFGVTVGSVYLNGDKREWQNDLPGVSRTVSVSGSILGGFYSSSVDNQTNRVDRKIEVHGLQFSTPSSFNVGWSRSRTVGHFTITF